MLIKSQNDVREFMRTSLINDPIKATATFQSFQHMRDLNYPPKNEWRSSRVEFEAYLDTMTDLVLKAPNVPSFNSDWSQFFTRLDWARIFYCTELHYRHLCAARLGCRVSEIADALMMPGYYRQCSQTESESDISPTPARAKIQPHYASANSNDVDDMMYD
jgi:hypothetical protein